MLMPQACSSLSSAPHRAARQAGEIMDFVHLDIERKGHVVTQQLKAGIADQMGDIALGPCKEIVQA